MCRCPVEVLPSARRLHTIRDQLRKSYVVSFNSLHQLGTVATIRLALSHAFGSTSSAARPLVTADEMDQIVRSELRDQAAERLFDAILGMFDRVIRVGFFYMIMSALSV